MSGITRGAVKFAAVIAVAAAAAVAIIPAANAQTSGSVGPHSVGFASCNGYDSTVTFYSPRMYAVNARYGSLNDFQHVAYTAYFYDSAGNPIGNGGRFVSWLYPGFRASDSGSATFNDYASQTYQFSGHATISIWIFEEWFDYPSTNGWGATHNIRTGWAWEPVGTCNV